MKNLKYNSLLSTYSSLNVTYLLIITLTLCILWLIGGVFFNFWVLAHLYQRDDGKAREDADDRVHVVDTHPHLDLSPLGLNKAPLGCKLDWGSCQLWWHISRKLPVPQVTVINSKFTSMWSLSQCTILCLCLSLTHIACFLLCLCLCLSLSHTHTACFINKHTRA